MANYLQVSSNDSLSHRALPGSPDTLCGKLIADEIQPRDHSVDQKTHPNTNWLDQPLVCDICEALSNQGAFLNTGAELQRRVKDEYGNSARPGQWTEPGFDNPVDDDTTPSNNMVGRTTLNKPPVPLRADSNPATPPSQNGHYGSARMATNWTRDGIPIEDGFNVVISKEEAARIPFLDFARVSVSEKRECPDCKDSHWLSKIASCDTCGTMKCINCMEDVGPSQFLGICKTCAGADSDLAYESIYEDQVTDQDRFLRYQLGDDDTSVSDAESLFLPDAGEIQGY